MQSMWDAAQEASLCIPDGSYPGGPGGADAAYGTDQCTTVGTEYTPAAGAAGPSWNPGGVNGHVWVTTTAAHASGFTANGLLAEGDECSAATTMCGYTSHDPLSCAVNMRLTSDLIMRKTVCMASSGPGDGTCPVTPADHLLTGMTVADDPK